MILRTAERISEALVVHDLAGAQKTQGVADIGIVDQAQKVVVGDSCLLLCCYRSRATKSTLAGG